MTARRGPSVLRSSGASISFAQEFGLAGDRHELVQVTSRVLRAIDALDLTTEERGFVEIGRAAKKNYAQRLSNALAQKVADALRPRFPTVLPTPDGKRQESRSMGASGLKKLDVNYSTPEMGLGLGVSIKTINFMDEATRRYTKNVKRVDGELRAEAQDYHQRQPYALLAALIFLPIDAAVDGAGERSSLQHAWDVFRGRAGREIANDDHARFERIWIGLYETDDDLAGQVIFHDVNAPTPSHGRPMGGVDFGAVIDDLSRSFVARNRK